MEQTRLRLVIIEKPVLMLGVAAPNFHDVNQVGSVQEDSGQGAALEGRQFIACARQRFQAAKNFLLAEGDDFEDLAGELGDQHRFETARFLVRQPSAYALNYIVQTISLRVHECGGDHCVRLFQIQSIASVFFTEGEKTVYKI